MPVELPLSTTFVSCLAELRRGEASGALEAALQEIVDAARAKWPGVSLPTDAYLRFLADRLAADPDVRSALGRLHTADMFLVAACVEGDAQALAYFDDELLAATGGRLLGGRLTQDVVDEARQVLRHRLFVGTRDAAPKALAYSGTGALRSWVRASLARAALRVARRPKGHVDTDQVTLGAAASPAHDLELDYLKRLYGAEANEALRESFGELEARQRNLLRQTHALGLGIDEISAFYRVHRSTAARWVREAREALVKRTREALERRLNIDRSDASSILRLVRSQLDEALRALLTMRPGMTRP